VIGGGPLPLRWSGSPARHPGISPGRSGPSALHCGRPTLVTITASACLLGSPPGSGAELLDRELRSAAVVEAMLPLCLDAQPEAAELYVGVIHHWWERNPAVREAMHELAFGSSTPEGLDRRTAFEELVLRLRDEVVGADSAEDLAECCAAFMAGLAAGLEPKAAPGDPCATET
jgi:hypothetical protein